MRTRHLRSGRYAGIPNDEVMVGGLAPRDSLNSLFSIDIAEVLDRATGVQIQHYGPRLGRFLLDLLADPDDEIQMAALTRIDLASSQGQLSADVAETVQSKVAELDLTRLSGSDRAARRLLSAITSMAAGNGWFAAKDRLNETWTRMVSPSLELDSSGLSELLNAAFHLSRLEATPLDRLNAFKRRLGDLSALPRAKIRIAGLAEHFAMALSGEHAQPFLDLRARLLAERE